MVTTIPGARRLARVTKISKVALAVPLYPLSLNKPKHASWIRQKIEDTGCLAVKIGQWVSSRTDVFPPSLTDEFARLRSDVAPMSSENVTTIVQQEVGIGYFDSFEDVPISTGSIAQVHRAVLKGKEVAVKIQRPGLEEELTDDIQIILAFLMPYKWVNPKMYDDLTTSLRDLVATVRMELDFPLEAKHMKRFASFFASNPSYRIPQVFEATSKLIIMEYVPSMPLVPSQGHRISDRLMELFFLQFFELGYVHTDLHGGNLGIDTYSDAIVVYDFGSVMECPKNLRLCVKQLLVAYLNRNPQMMVEYLLEYGVLLPSTIADDERRTLEQFLDKVLTYAEESDIKKFTGEVKNITVPQHNSSDLHFQPEVFMLLRSFTLLEGLCKDLDEDFVILNALLPLVGYFATDPMIYRLKLEDDVRTMLTFFFQ
jgi:predicted unusual protein kinase regulating ubiquinone biosynthesis (AarF/ABC1/UbiB family)